MMTIVRRLARTALILALTSLLQPAQSLSQDAAEGARKLLHRSSPQYPELARRMNISGSVRVEAVVASNGTVKSVDVKGGHPVLVQAAIVAVRQWKWETAPHETHELVEVKFATE